MSILLALPSIPPSTILTVDVRGLEGQSYDRSASTHNLFVRCSGRSLEELAGNVTSKRHEVAWALLRTLALPQDGRPARLRSNDNSGGTSSTGSSTIPSTSVSPDSRGDDSVMSDAASTTASHASPGHSIAFSDVSRSDAARSYHLEVIQHPERTAEIGTTAVLSRLPLSPPLVVKISVEDADGNLLPVHNEMPFLTAHLQLYSEDTAEPIDVVDSSGAGGEPERMLYGTLVSSPHHLKDTNNQPGMFFIFPDVSVRRRGTYTLRIDLLRLTNLASGPPSVMPEGMANSALASTFTDPFVVVTQSEFIAPPATALTSHFHRQGARMYTPFQPR